VPARIGVIGCGWWATQAHLPALTHNPDAVLAALADPSEERLRAAADSFGVSATYTDTEEMLSSAELDGVVIAVPHAQHYPLTRAALEHGKHVLLEKPMTILPEHAHELLELSRARGVELVIGYPWHYNEQAVAVREIIRSGRIGQIEHAACLFASAARALYAGDPEGLSDVLGYPVNLPEAGTYSDPAVAGGGQGQTQVTHSAALLLWMTGLEVESVAATIANFELEVDLVDALSVRFRNGAVGSLASTGSVTGGHAEILEYRLFGTDGHLLFDVLAGTASVHASDGRSEELAPLPADRRYPEWGPANNLVDIILGRAANGSPAEVGVAVVELVDAMYRSARQRRSVSIRSSSGAHQLGLVWRVKPGKEEEYARLHVDIWPALRELMVGHGATAFSIFLWGTTVFAQLECDDFPALVAALADDPVSIAWEKQFEGILEYPNADPETGWPERLREVWSL
jgi:predicted dehydrogenase/L-rhamnose mutarotase